MAHLGRMIPPSAKLVMLMEDEDDIARLVAHHLESSGFRIHRPARPYSLISDAEEDRPTLFILDLMLPEVDGFQLCRSIRDHSSLRDVPILILTASTAAEDRKRALESGADGYITKPFSPSALIATVRMLSDRSSSGER
jgi:two-component system phosphate regulon response regulator PhoB